MIVNGDNGKNTLTGSNDADTINGYNDVDKLYGLGGNDILIGGLGDDTIDGGGGLDLVSYAYAAKKVVVDLAAGTGQASETWGDYDTLVGIENVWGSNFDDTIAGTSGANELTGRHGNDVLDGRGGADALSGGNGMDTATYAGSAVGVNINLATGKGQSGDAEGDTLFSIEKVVGSAHGDWIQGGAGHDWLEGGGGVDYLWGKDGSDMLFGGAGADVLEGHGGIDSLIGGAGADTFVFNHVDESKAAAPDLVADFSRIQGDKIGLGGIDARTHTSGQQDFNFIGTSGFWMEGQVRYYHENNRTYVEANVYDGDTAEMKIAFEGIHDFVASDFFL